ncbi:hypothetical protein RA224_12815 [Achromobacter aegrifaciens]|uniref:hypothetical protein n=1 Tax=Achromobacter aegrifaciens TaxID=1287736 RepID=UPI0027B894E7|nr:hypothetical protein [Achromobacter aegrifaciens]WLW64266.1 hypothetical protein RA224_12815 [Achromobacter aegrifaciens]
MNTPKTNQAAMQDPISEAISILTADAASIRESHTPLCDRDDWNSEPETKAYYDRLLRVAAELSKLRAPVADELVDSLARYAYYYAVDLDRHTRNADLDQLEGISRRATAKLKAEIRATLTSAQVDPEAAEVDFMVRVFENLDTWRAEDWNELLERRPAILALLRPMVLASAPVAGEAQADLAPPKCPITGRPFFMALEHPELGRVPTYGGPYDSYTIPHLGGKPDQPWHERDLRVYRYDHDLGGWIADETEVIPLRIVHEDVLHGLEDAAPQASEALPSDYKVSISQDVPSLGIAMHQASEAVRDAGTAASAPQLVAAAKAMTKLYPHVWDRTDGSLIVFPENVAKFDAAFDALRVALGEAVEDDDSAALSAQPGAQKDGGSDAN